LRDERCAILALSAAGGNPQPGEAAGMTDEELPLYALLAQLLVALTYDVDTALARELGVERGNVPSLAMWANFLRLVGDEGIALEDMGPCCGIAKPTMKSMAGCLERHGWISIDAGVVRLTERGCEARRAWSTTHATIDARWRAALGPIVLEALQACSKDANERFGGLPYYPMPAAHRGAYPRGE